MSNFVWPHRWQPTGSSIPEILQARILEWVAISFSNAWKWKVKVKSLSCVWLLATPWTVAYQAPPSMGFSRQEYRRGLPFPSPLQCLGGLNPATALESPGVIPLMPSSGWPWREKREVVLGIAKTREMEKKKKKIPCTGRWGQVRDGCGSSSPDQNVASEDDDGSLYKKRRLRDTTFHFSLPHQSM